MLQTIWLLGIPMIMDISKYAQSHGLNLVAVLLQDGAITSLHGTFLKQVSTRVSSGFYLVKWRMVLWLIRICQKHHSLVVVKQCRNTPRTRQPSQTRQEHPENGVTIAFNIFSYHLAIERKCGIGERGETPKQVTGLENDVETPLNCVQYPFTYLQLSQTDQSKIFNTFTYVGSIEPQVKLEYVYIYMSDPDSIRRVLA